MVFFFEGQVLPYKRIQNPDWLNVSSVWNLRLSWFFDVNNDAPNGIVPENESNLSLSCKLNDRF